MLERPRWTRGKQRDAGVLPLLSAGPAAFPAAGARHRWAGAGEEEEEEEGEEEGWCRGNPGLSIPSRGKAGGGGDPVALRAVVQ